MRVLIAIVGATAILVLALAGIREGDAQDVLPVPGDAAAGKRLFHDTDWSATRITCIHCHADFNEKNGTDYQFQLKK